jgi:hypothetical protein
MIEFRWVALITLWTMLIGPVFDLSPSASRAQQTRTQAVAARR